MQKIFLLLFLVASILASCSSIKVQNFKSDKPALDPVKFFGGHTHSVGLLENRNGKPSNRISTKTKGDFKNGLLVIEQDLFPENKKPNHRVFNLKIIDDHHIESTGSDIDAVARGELFGNYFTWRYRMKIADKGLIRHINITQYMLLMPDGKTLIIRSVIRKFGIIVKEITEQFSKDD